MSVLHAVFGVIAKAAGTGNGRHTRSDPGAACDARAVHIPDENVHDFVLKLGKPGTASALLHKRCALNSSTNGGMPHSNDSRDQSPFGGPYFCCRSDSWNAYQGAEIKAPQNDERVEHNSSEP